MCLRTKMLEPAIAQKDIVVYKWLNEKEDKLYAPYYRHFNYTLNKEHKTFLFCIYGTVNDGFHSIKNRITAVFHYAKYGCINKANLFKCVIPKGSKYYTGQDTSGSNKGFASDTIIIKRKLIFNLF